MEFLFNLLPEIGTTPGFFFYTFLIYLFTLAVRWCFQDDEDKTESALEKERL